MRPQPHVEVKDALRLRLDPLQDFLSQPLEVLTVVQGAAPGGPARPAIDEQHFNVGRIPELPTAELAKAEHGERTWSSAGQPGGTVSTGKHGLAGAGGLFDHHLGQLGERAGKVR